ncbi:AbgT family transporter [Tissierellaceae bacterium HCP3S3_D8]
MEERKVKKRFGQRILDGIENIGNKLWDPVSLFLILCFILLVVSFGLSKKGTFAIHPGTGERIEAINLLSKESLQVIIGNITGNFQGFPPLGLVLIVMMGAGLADKTGLMTAAIRGSVMKAPDNLVTAIIVFLGINAVAVGDAGFVVLPPLAAAVYLGLGRHPLAGLYAAFASVAGGFAASLMVQMGDVVAASFTIPAAQMIDPNYTSTAAMNYYFMIVSTLVILPVGVLVNNKIIEPRLGEYKGQIHEDGINGELSEIEKRGLKRSGLSALVLIVLLIALSVGDGAFMKDPNTNSIFTSGAPLMTGIVPIVTSIFLIPAIVYGITVGNIKSDRDAIRMMGESVGEMGGYIVLAFAASQFLALFSTSNIGALISIKGAEFLQNVGFTGIGAIISFIIVASIVNLFMGSAGAKWAIMAPVFVPMFMLLGYDPALTQACYRIGDSITNPLTPLFSYFPILLGFVKRYDEDAGMGTIISNMIPYSILFAISWILLLIVFMIFDIPLGPGGGIYL